jgi:hypothetical protein
MIARRLQPKKSGRMPSKQPRAESEELLHAGRSKFICITQGLREGGEG